MDTNQPSDVAFGDFLSEIYHRQRPPRKNKADRGREGLRCNLWALLLGAITDDIISHRDPRY